MANELDIPLFTILAPHRQSLTPGLRPSRPWWDFDPSLPADVKREMYFMEQVADELMRRSGDGDSTWANLDMMLDDTGNLVFASFRGSPPDLGGPTFPRTGDLIVAELCSWGCDKAMEVLEREQFMDQQYAAVSMRETLEQNLGRILLRAMRGAPDGIGSFVVPVGSEEVHVQMSLKPFPRPAPDDPLILNLVEQMNNAAEKVRHSRRPECFPDGPGDGVQGPPRDG